MPKIKTVGLARKRVDAEGMKFEDRMEEKMDSLLAKLDELLEAILDKNPPGSKKTCDDEEDSGDKIKRLVSPKGVGKLKELAQKYGKKEFKCSPKFACDTCNHQQREDCADYFVNKEAGITPATDEDDENDA